MENVHVMKCQGIVTTIKFLPLIFCRKDFIEHATLKMIVPELKNIYKTDS